MAPPGLQGLEYQPFRELYSASQPLASPPSDGVRSASKSSWAKMPAYFVQVPRPFTPIHPWQSFPEVHGVHVGHPATPMLLCPDTGRG